MAKILGMSMALVSGLILLGQIFIYQNSSAHLIYNPLDKNFGLADVGLILPVVFTLIFFVIGVVMYKSSTEPELY